MAADSVGQIGLDLVVNDGSFKKQMAGIQGMAKKAAAALAGAFAVKKIADFGAQCIELGSDLAEVQNVVDVTFPRMSKQIDQFAKNAAAQFGLSETMAKKFSGTFGAMAKAFGFGEKSAYEMSTALTGLAGDVASFYNISQDEAYTKLKSVFTGETETLKDLGIVMTQNSLDAYAMANGYGKTTKAMSEMEKVALRYAFVQDQLTLASGDFIRTSDGWANQVRILKLQFDSLKATLGQGLINVLTPVIQVINTIIGKLMSLANAFKAFTELITGKKSGGGASDAAAGMEALAASADKAGAAASGAGSAAKKAAKDMKGSTTGIDELNIIQAPEESGSGSGAGGGYAVDEFDMGEIDTSAVDEMESKYQGLIDKAKELATFFKVGFQVGFGDTSVLDSIQSSISGIKESLKGIFTDPEVVSAADKFATQVSYNFGKITGSFASIGATVADNLLGGLEISLRENSPRIKGFLVSMFDIGSDFASISGRFTDAVSDIFTVFRGPAAKQITADIIAIFSDGLMGTLELVSGFAIDFLDLLTSPIINNSGLIEDALGGILDSVQIVTGSIKETFTYFVETVLKLYSGKISPLIDSIKKGLSEIVSHFLSAFNAYILPIIKNAAERFSEFNSRALQPLIDKFGEFAGKVIECIQTVWEEWLLPFILWFIDSVVPVISDGLQIVINVFFAFLDSASEVISSVLAALTGLLDFIIGVFTGDWERAWNGIKQFFSNIWEAIRKILSAATNAIQSIIQSSLQLIKSVWETIWNTIKETVSRLIDEIHTKISTVVDTIKTNISTALENIKTTWNDTWETLKQKTEEIFNGIWATIKGIINSIIGGVERMANSVIRAINKMIEAINEVADVVPGIDSDLIPTISEIHLPRLAKGGFVRANTPQLAMIGDNRHYGEIVAPEDKMQEMVNRAVAMTSQSSGMSDQYLLIMIDLLKKIIELIEEMDLTVTIDIREIRKRLSELDKRTGYKLRTT